MRQVWRASTHCPQPQREKNRFAFLCGYIGVTALVQSSNATTLLVTSFVARDLVAALDARAGDRWAPMWVLR